LDKSYSELEACLGDDIHKTKWTTLQVPPTPNIYERFITAIQTGKQGEPDFARGAEIQKSLDACFESDKLGHAVKV
jgi:predicted dehydrogenase